MFVQVMARALAARGHRVTILGPWQETGSRFDGPVEIREFAPSKVRRIAWLLTRRRWRQELKRLHAEHPIDIVESMDWQGTMTGVHGVLPSRVPRVVRIQGSQIFFGKALQRPTDSLIEFLERRTFAVADHIVAITDYARRATSELVPIGSKPYSILPNPIDTEAFNPRLNTKTEPGLVMFVGTMTKKKGVEELAKAWSEVRRRCPDARLELIAKDTKDNERGGMFSERVFAALPSDVRASVVWRGAMEHDQLPGEMARASVLVFPSHIETQAIVACEAMALGKPTVFSSTGPGPEVMVDGESGLLINPFHPEEIANALIRLLEDAPLRERLGAAARQRVMERFSLEHLVVENEKLYQRLSKGS